MTYCCSAEMLGQNVGANNGSGGPLVNWTKICNLGTSGQCEAAWKMPDALFPNFITCAGTLGGSGGVGWCTFTSKAGKGGGGGQAKCQIVCIFNSCFTTC
jgi:hypothetical protein